MEEVRKRAKQELAAEERKLRGKKNSKKRLTEAARWPLEAPGRRRRHDPMIFTVERDLDPSKTDVFEGSRPPSLIHYAFGSSQGGKCTGVIRGFVAVSGPPRS